MKRYKSGALAAVHETALGLSEAGVLPRRTMRAFDELCLTPVEELSPDQLRRLRAALVEGEKSGFVEHSLQTFTDSLDESS